MKLDTMRRYAETDAVDAVVIGTGAGGAPILSRLAEAGLKVVALEAGKNWEPGEHTPDEKGASDIYWLGERLSAGEMPNVFGGNNSGTGVGGSTLHWGAFCPRPDPRDLKLKTTTGQGVDWPLSHAELVSYIERVEAFVGVSGPAVYPWDTGRRYPMPPVARNAPAEAMARGCAALGITCTDGPVAVASRDWPQPHWGLRHACVNCGACHQGCRNAAKVTMDTSYLPNAVAFGAEIRPDSMVTNVERDSAGRITAVVYQSHGQEHRQRCHNVFLCAGGVETPRLLLNLGLANSSGQVGRNYMAHVATQVWGRFDAEMRMNRGYPSPLITEDTIRAADATHAGGYLIQSLGVQPATVATSFARGGEMWGEKLVNLIDNYLHLGGIGINGDCLPQEQNFLELADETDAFGLKKARVTFSYGPNEKAMDEHSRKLMARIWEAAGAKDIFAVPRAAHTIGTCRMGDDRDTCVVNAEGRSFDIDNLFVCDNSVFPSALPANPALTIMALGLRTAEKFLAK